MWYGHVLGVRGRGIAGIVLQFVLTHVAGLVIEIENSSVLSIRNEPLSRAAPLPGPLASPRLP